VVPGTDPLVNQTIIVEGNRISRIEPEFIVPNDSSKVLDLRDQFVLPGLMDMHVHLLLELGPNTLVRSVTEGSTFTAMRGVANARKTLEAGFTTVRDLGGDPESIYAIREAVKEGLIPGPRIVAAGSVLAATGGHGDVDGIRADLMTAWTPKTICDGAIACRKAVRYAVKFGADWIKITATGGVLSDSGTGLDLQMTDDELSEIVRTAHQLKIKVAAHAHGTDGINAALKAGVDSIEHGTFLDSSSIALFKNHNTSLIPTLMPGAYVVASMGNNPFFTDAIKQKAYKASAQSKAGFKIANEAGVRIVFGTDTGVTPHGQNAKEFALMVDAGMSPARAIRAATLGAAEMLGMQDELGTLEVGKLADMISVRGDPLADISVLESVLTVIKDGKIEKATR